MIQNIKIQCNAFKLISWMDKRVGFIYLLKIGIKSIFIFHLRSKRAVSITIYNKEKIRYFWKYFFPTDLKKKEFLNMSC